MTQKTALAELIEEYQKEWDKNGMGASISISSLIVNLKSKLPKERQDLIDAWEDGESGIGHSPKQYVFEKFGI